MKSIWNSKRGLGWIVTAFFIAADMVGGGLVAMPVAFLNTGLVMGCFIMLVLATLFAYTAYLLGINWVIMQERWPEYQEHCRKPYPEMALRSMGTKMKVFTSFIVCATMFGTAVVYILLSTRIFQSFLGSIFDVQIPFCLLLVVVTINIMPLAYLKSPADFWLVVIISLGCTVLAILMSIGGIAVDTPACFPEAKYPPLSIWETLYSLGTFFFAFSGHQVLPTIQHDMYRPKEFTKSVILGFIIISILYMPISIYAFLVYGDSMSGSVMDSIQTPAVRHVANISIALHCILALIMMANPLCQQAEDFFNVPHTFGLKRVVVRTSIILAMLFMALLLPNFGPFMNLAGSITNLTVCVILPMLFNLYIEASVVDRKNGQYKIPSFAEIVNRTNKAKLAVSTFIVVTAIFGTILCVYLSLKEVLTVRFTPPCFFSSFDSRQFGENFDTHHIRCCGSERNILSIVNSTGVCYA